MIDKQAALEIANKFFAEKNQSEVAKLLEAPTHWICYDGPADRVIYGKAGIKIDKETGQTELFILPNKENFELLHKAVPIDIA